MNGENASEVLVRLTPQPSTIAWDILALHERIVARVRDGIEELGAVSANIVTAVTI